MQGGYPKMVGRSSLGDQLHWACMWVYAGVLCGVGGWVFCCVGSLVRYAGTRTSDIHLAASSLSFLDVKLSVL